MVKVGGGKMKNILSLTLVLMLCLFGSTAFADARADYERYVSAYNSYRNAVLENKSEAEVKKLLNSYLDAKNVYEKGTQRQSSEVLDGTDRNADNSADYQDFVGVDTSTPGATATQQVQQIPEGLKRILDQLWSEKGQKSPDAMMKLLDAFIKNNPTSKFVDMARYELAKAYDLLKNDQKSSSEILNDIVKNNPNSKAAFVARQRLSFYQATKHHQQWKQVLDSSYADSQQSYQKYRDTSWLAFPVKATRWAGYVSKLLKFNSNQDKFDDFQISYEKLGAQFAPPVNITFDRFVPATGKSNKPAEVSLRYSNSESWYGRWKLLNEARRSIDIQYFIMDKDIFGMSMLGTLLKKAREGVKIRLMLDARGTKTLTRKLLGQDFLQELSELPNCEIKVFNPVHTNLLTLVTDLRKIMASNHDKIIVIDGEYSIVGGRNVSKDYFLEVEDHPSCYRDTDVFIRCDDVARQLSHAFDEEFTKLKTFKIGEELWGNIDIMSHEMFAARDTMFSHMLNERFTVTAKADKKYLNSAREFLNELAPYSHLRGYAGFDVMSNAVDAYAKIIDKHSLGGPRNDITDEMVKYIDGCKKEVLIQNPYVVLTDRIFAALQRAGRKGVSVKIHTNSPYSTDSLATQAMFYSQWKQVMSEIPNIRVFVYYGKRKLHAKNWVFDGKIGVVGTYNLDWMSEQINSEVVAAIKSNEFAQQLRGEIYQDLRESKEYQVTIDASGKVQSVFGPDDLQGKNFWLLKTISKLTFIKKLI